MNKHGPNCVLLNAKLSRVETLTEAEKKLHGIVQTHGLCVVEFWQCNCGVNGS